MGNRHTDTQLQSGWPRWTGMGNPFDQLGKKIGLRALGPSGRTAAQHEIHSNARQADLRHEPEPAREAERARLGLLGRLAAVPCLIEMFSSAPGEEKVVDCVGKLISYRQERRREASRARRRRRDPPQATPTPPFARPFLWIVSARRPSSGIAMFAAAQAEGWPSGVYLTPATTPKAGRRRQPGRRREPGGLRLGFVVAGELPRERATILVRIMAGGTALPAALADLAALPARAYERDVASGDVLELRRVLGRKSRRTKEEEAFIVTTRDAFEELKEEGRQEGRAEEAARILLTVLRARGIAVPGAARKRILAQKDPARIERWIERAVVAASLTDALTT
jgi:hypothetical protein